MFLALGLLALTRPGPQGLALSALLGFYGAALVASVLVEVGSIRLARRRAGRPAGVGSWPEAWRGADGPPNRLAATVPERAQRRDERYELQDAPEGTRCGFCRCDFFPQEVACVCLGCASLVHAECATELVRSPGPQCPTYGCAGSALRRERGAESSGA